MKPTRTLALALSLMACEPEANEQADAFTPPPTVDATTDQSSIDQGVLDAAPPVETDFIIDKEAFGLNIHTFTNFWSEQQTANAAASIKTILLGHPDADTCVEGPDGRVQIGVQTEFIMDEYRGDPEAALQNLGQRLDAFHQAGLPVDLLLPVHHIPDRPPEDFPDAHGFLPYEPTSARNRYDDISETFHLPVIAFLQETGRLERLRTIYVANEFGYLQGGEPEARQQGLAKTAERLIHNAHEAVGGQVPIGIKFARLSTPQTGWTPAQAGQLDPFAEVVQRLRDIDGVLSYDVYYEGDDYYDLPNRDRIAPFLTPDTNFNIGEFGRLCEGRPGDFQTTADDVARVHQDWPEAQSLNLFALYTGQCYSLAEEPTARVYPAAEGAVSQFRNLIQTKTGAVEPVPCQN